MLEALMAFAMSAFPISQTQEVPPEGDPSVSAASWSCDAERWVSPPVVVDGTYKGHIYSNCLIQDAQNGGLRALESFMNRKTAASRVVHAGPIAETYEGLPGSRYDVTIGGEDGSDSLTMRQDVHVVTDRARRFLYHTISRKIQGEGMAGYLTKAQIRLEVWATGQPDTYRIQASNYVEAEKPWFAPGGVFRSEAEKAQTEQFRKIRDRSLPEVAKTL